MDYGRRREREGRKRLDGTWVHAYRSGTKRCAGAYEDGLETGQWTYWYENGLLAAQGRYIEGYEHGIWVYRYDNKALRARGAYAHGLRDGLWKYYHEDGTVERWDVWEMGKPIRRLCVVLG